jgi:hypothetical protein
VEKQIHRGVADFPAEVDSMNAESQHKKYPVERTLFFAQKKGNAQNKNRHGFLSAVIDGQLTQSQDGETLVCRSHA